MIFTPTIRAVTCFVMFELLIVAGALLACRAWDPEPLHTLEQTMEAVQ